MTLEDALAEAPIVAIIRGVTPEEVLAQVDALCRAGVRVVEVPLNSPHPMRSIQLAAEAFRGRMVVGAGTVLTPAQVDEVADAGGRIAVAPNTDPAVIRHALARGLEPFPGFATATEAFAAYAAGARRLKLFPASTYGTAHLRALMAVLPKDAAVYAVGGAGPDTMAEWRASGAQGFGLGSDLYKPGQGAAETFEKAARAVAAAKA
ncbi:MAG TPA: 2-dehydro-3-deoxy-6-phosphogalactonate aldolase [Caulobacteraceae bacterium]|nr:2-dehydro-3-deoxy-6-phosphogalactonate aldolase [Caulobacteraceae bacterium]